MEEEASFQDVFGSDPNIEYSQKLTQEILRARQKLDGTLFFDRLAQTMGIEQPSNIYPPRSHSELRKLHARVQSCTSPSHHKHSLLYYLLIDLSLSGKHSAASFSRTSAFLPTKYATLIDGLWRLDRLDFARALDHLTSPTLIPTFPEETLAVLVRHTSPAGVGDPDLVLGYYHAVTPELRDRDVRDAVFRCMCAAQLTEAFFWARRQADAAHRHLLETLVWCALSAPAAPSPDAKAAAAAELVGLPMSRAEEAWFEEYLLTGAGGSLPGGRDAVVMRRVRTGRLADARKLVAEMKETRVDGATWSALLEAAS